MATTLATLVGDVACAYADAAPKIDVEALKSPHTIATLAIAGTLVALLSWFAVHALSTIRPATTDAPSPSDREVLS